MMRQRLLVTYDIRDERRLRAVHRTMKSYGDPLQYSVFVCDLSDIERVRMTDALSARINNAADSVAIINLGNADLSRFEFLGTRLLDPPEGGPTIV